MIDIYTKEEWSALDQKALNPTTDVKCPAVANLCCTALPVTRTKLDVLRKTVFQKASEDYKSQTVILKVLSSP